MRNYRSRQSPEPDQPEQRAPRPADPLARVAHDRPLGRLLETAEITDCQLVPYGSNYTFAVALEQPDADPLVGIYKPRNGEAPLWDFDSGTLYRREYASYLLSRVLGWHFIPPTVIRGGPHGVGTVQQYIEPRRETSRRSQLDDREAELRRICLFDVLTNNADRKGSHFFVGEHDGRLWGIDHGLTFNVQPKLRTVIWDYCGEPIPEDLRDDLRRLVRHQRAVQPLLAPYLSGSELRVLFRRAADLLLQPVYPHPTHRRSIPYGW